MTSIDWVGEYGAARTRICELAAGLDDAQLSTIVPACPDWTVSDTLAHVAGIAVALTEGDFPSGDQQAWLDGLVEKRRGRPTSEVLDEWNDAGEATAAFLGGLGPGGGQMVYDVVAHEHDIRHALRLPGARDTSGVVACATAMSGILQGDLAKSGLPAVRITSADRTWDVGDGEPGLEIELEPFELIRAFGSRRSERQVRALPWKGDLDRYLPALAHHPFPADDIVE
jgi:uncharacterized protein (TIGR03083 family)